MPGAQQHGAYSGELSRIVFNLVRKILPSKICSLSQYPSKDLSLLLGSKDGSKIGQDSQQVMQTIINATQEDQINIVHIFSCQSNLAHGALERLNGDIVLCTYAHWAEAIIIRTCHALSSYHANEENYIAALTKYFPEYL